MSRISNEILAYTLKRPFEISVSRNDIEKSPSALHFEKYRKVRNCKKKVVKDVVESLLALRTTPSV